MQHEFIRNHLDRQPAKLLTFESVKRTFILPGPTVTDIERAMSDLNSHEEVSKFIAFNADYSKPHSVFASRLSIWDRLFQAPVEYN